MRCSCSMTSSVLILPQLTWKPESRSCRTVSTSPPCNGQVRATHHEFHVSISTGERESRAWLDFASATDGFSSVRGIQVLNSEGSMVATRLRTVLSFQQQHLDGCHPQHNWLCCSVLKEVAVLVKLAQLPDHKASSRVPTRAASAFFTHSVYPYSSFRSES